MYFSCISQKFYTKHMAIYNHFKDEQHSLFSKALPHPLKMLIFLKLL